MRSLGFRMLLVAAAVLSAAAFGSAPVFAQGAVQVMPPVTYGHGAMWFDPGHLMDAGGPTANGQPPLNNANPGVSPLGYQWVNSGLGTCAFSAYANVPYSRLCMGFDGNGNALFTIDGFGTTPGADVRINGVLYPFIAGGGNVVGPSVSVVGDDACFANSSGTLLADCKQYVDTMAQLVALNASSTAVPVILRGYYNRGDIDPVSYTGTNAACSGGANGGSRVTGANANCWVASTPSQGWSPLQFGAVGDGTTNDRVAVQNTMDASTNATILLGPHVYAIGDNTALVCNNPIKMVGNVGFGNTPRSGFVPKAINQTIINAGTSGCIGSTFEDFYLGMSNSGTDTTGFAINASLSANLTFSRITIDGGCGGIDMSGFYWSIDHVQMTNMSGGTCQGIRLGHATNESGNTGRLTNTDIFSVSGAARLGVGVQIEDCGGCFFEHNDIIATNIGTYIIPGTGGANQQVVFNFFHDTILGDTTNSVGFLIDTAAADARVLSLQCNGCWSSTSQTNFGIEIANTGATTPTLLNGFHFVGARVLSNAQHGILLNAGTNIDIDSSTVCGNNTSAGSFDGIVVASGISKVRIRGGSVGGGCEDSGTTQAIGIEFAGTTTDALVQGVDLTQGNTTPINYGGGLTASRIEGNPGFNPVGSSNISVGASPFGYQAGPTPEYVCTLGGTVSGIQVDSVQVSTGAADGCVSLAPNQTMIVTYSMIPTMNTLKQ